MSGRPETIIDINEATVENMMCGPVVEIKRDAQILYGGVIGRFNTQGFMKYGQLVEKYHVDSLEIKEPGIFTKAEGYFFHPHLETVKDKNAIRTLYVGGTGTLDSKFDVSVLSEFENIRCLVTDMIAFEVPLCDYFPHLEAWLNFDWKSNPVKSLGEAWPNLKYLHIQGFKGSLNVFAGRDLRRLFLISPSLATLEELELFPNLDTLFIMGLRKGLDLSPISRLQNLKNLSIEGKTKFTGWENFGSKTVCLLRMDWMPNSDPLSRFPALEHCYVGRLEEEKKNYYGNWDEEEIDSPFTLVVPTLPVSV
jgi:hypothetical protein